MGRGQDTREREERQRDRGDRTDYCNLEIEGELICGFVFACGLTAMPKRPFFAASQPKAK